MTYVGFNPQPNTEDPRAVRAERIESDLDDAFLGDGDDLSELLVRYLSPSDVASILADILVRNPNSLIANAVRKRLGEKMMAEPYDKGHDED